MEIHIVQVAIVYSPLAPSSSFPLSIGHPSTDSTTHTCIAQLSTARVMAQSRAGHTTGTFYPEVQPFQFLELDAGTPFVFGSIPQPPLNLSNPVAKEDDGTVTVTQQINELSLTISQSCGQCQSVNAVSFCSKCQSFLCELCNDAHKRMATFKGHTTVHPDQANTLSTKNCPKHPNEVLETYCTDCKSLVCQDCVLFFCYEHKTTPVDSATADIKAHLKSDFEHLRAHLQSFRSRAVIIAQLEKHVATYPDKIKSFITEKQQEEKHKEEQIKQVDTHYSDFSKALNTEKDSIRKAIATIEAEIKSAHQLMTRKGVSNSEFAVLGIQAFLSMQKAKTLTWDPNIENLGFLICLLPFESRNIMLVNIETALKLKAEGYYTSIAGHFSKIEKNKDTSAFSKRNTSFLKNGLHCVNADLFCRNKTPYHQSLDTFSFPQISISCLITGPSTLAIPCTIMNDKSRIFKFNPCPSTPLLTWNIYFETAEVGCYSFKVELKLNDDVYYEIAKTITLK